MQSSELNTLLKLIETASGTDRLRDRVHDMAKEKGRKKGKRGSRSKIGQRTKWNF